MGNSCLTIIFFLAITNFENIFAITNIDPVKKEQIDNFVNSLLTECDKHINIVGLNLAVVHEREILYTTGYGVKNLDTNEPVTENTVYNIGSVTKHFTTTLLGQTLSNHGYNWDAKVSNILDDLGTEFYFYDPLRSNLTSLRDLGSHSNGMARNDVLWALQEMSRSDQADRLRFIEGVAEPRTTFIYNNLMYTLQGHITELLAANNWEQLVQTEVFDKVGMANSSFIYYIDEESADIATAYMLSAGEPREVAWEAYSDMGEDMGPAGAITSTANDMARWMNMLLSGGLNEAGERVFNSDVLLETQSPVNAYSTSTQYYPPDFPISYSVWSSYGLGLGPGSYRGFRAIQHRGDLWGHHARLEFFPDINLGIYTTINGDEGFPSAMENIGLFVADVVLDEEPWLNSTTACTFPFPISSEKMKKQHENIDMPLNIEPNIPYTKLRQVDQYLGQYGNFAYGNLTVEADDVSEELIINFDVYSCSVANVTDDRFVCFGMGHFWFFSIMRIQFDDENNPSQFVDVTFVPTEGPVRFERGLLFEDAPGPRDHWPQCEEVFPDNRS